MIRYTCLWVILLALVAGCEQKRKADPQFTAGRSALKRGEYQQAVTTFQNYLQEHRKGRLASRASFLIAKAFLGLGDLEKARQQFEATIREYGKSEEAHKSRYKLAVVSLLQGDRADALRRFRQLADRPDGTLAPESAAMVRFLSKQNGE